jgi:hypothetical protein
VTNSALVPAADPEIDGYSLASAARCRPIFNLFGRIASSSGRGAPPYCCLCIMLLVATLPSDLLAYWILGQDHWEDITYSFPLVRHLILSLRSAIHR